LGDFFLLYVYGVVFCLYLIKQALALELLYLALEHLDKETFAFSRS